MNGESIFNKHKTKNGIAISCSIRVHVRNIYEYQKFLRGLMHHFIDFEYFNTVLIFSY